MEATKPHRRQRTVNAILDAASEAFALMGVSNAKMDEIADRAGMARATLYYNFASKEEIAVALAERYRAKGYAEALRLKAEGASAAQILDAFFAYAGEWTAQNPEIARIGTLESLEGKGRSPERPPTGEVFRELVEQGQSEGFFRSDKDASSIAMILGALLAQTALLASQVDPEKGKARARSLLALALEGIGPQKAELRPAAPAQSLSGKE